MSFYKQGEKVALRDGFGKGLLVAGSRHSNVVALTADLESSLRMSEFAEKYPNRFFNAGIQEQNMAAVAAGLALDGYIPYIGSFGNFQPGRNLDQIRTSICMMNANVKIASSHTGFSYGEDGVTIQMLEDIAIMRALPNMRVLVPADANQAGQMVLEMLSYDGPEYLRLGRAEAEVLDPQLSVETLEIGKAQVLRPGNDLAIIAAGYLVHTALEVAEQYSERGLSIRVINMHTIKPLDAEEILQAARETGKIITAEEHQLAGGLGGAVAEVLAESEYRVPLRRLGVNDQFGETGTRAELIKSRGLSAQHLSQLVKDLL